MFTKKKKKQIRHESFETEQATTSGPSGIGTKTKTKNKNKIKTNNGGGAEDEYLLMRDDADRAMSEEDDDEKYGININNMALQINNNDIISDNLHHDNQSCLDKFGNINDNILGFINFIIIITVSSFMLFTIYQRNGINTHNDEYWTEEFMIFLGSMIIIPVIFILIRMNIIILHNRYYADYFHCLLIFIFILFFLFITILIIKHDGNNNNNDISKENMNLLLIISFIIIHFFIFNLTSRFWIFIHTQKFNTFLVLWLLTMIAFTFSIIIYIYYKDGDFNTFYNELYLLRSYYILLWIIIITYIHSKQFKLINKTLSIILSLEIILCAVTTPLLYILFGYDNKQQIDSLNYITNGLVSIAVIQLVLISIISTKKTIKKSKSFTFYTPKMCKCCASSTKCNFIFWIIICIISLPLIIFQSVSLCFFIQNDAKWRKIDVFGGSLLLWMMLILSMGFAVIPSSVFSNFWKKQIFENFLFLDLESLQILYNISRIKQMYGGLNINRRFLSLSSDIIAPWTVNYKKINYNHSSYDLCNNLSIGIITTTYIHFNYKLKQQSLWRKVFCCICDRKNIKRDDIKYNYYHKKEKGDDEEEENLNGESLEIDTERLQFTEFYPTKFANIRAWNGLSSELYIKTFEKSLLAFITNSKSGMYFFYTSNGKFLIKSLKKSEYYFFRKIFNEYYQYLKDHPNTLINRFYGMYRIKHNKDNIYFIVMESIFYSNLNVDTIYDLKGSTKGRISKDTEKVLKDLNWKNKDKKINIGAKAANLYKEQLKTDTLFLQRLKIMDYSLLVGIHFVDKQNSRNNNLYRLNDSFHHNKLSPFLFTFCHRGMPNREKTEIYFAGIIDILQKYNAKKKVENVMRRMANNQKEISCAPPKVYADRMCEFLNPYIL